MKKASATKRARGGAATTTQEKERRRATATQERQRGEGATTTKEKERVVIPLSCGGFPPLPLHGGYLLSLSLSLSHCFVAGFLSLTLSFYGCSFRSFLRWFRSLLFFAVVLCFFLSLFFLRGSPSPLSVCGCPSRSLTFVEVAFPPFFAVVLTFLSLFCSCVLCLFCMKEASTTTGKRENISYGT